MRAFRRHLNSLESIAEFTDSYVASVPGSADDVYAVRLAVEELFTNMLKYSSGGGDNVEIGLALQDGLLTVTLVDTGVSEWNPLLSREVNTAAGIDERRPGGLGLHLVKNMFDALDYKHENGTSTITLTRKMTNSDA